MFVASQYWITVVELPSYEKQIADLLTPEEADGLITQLAQEPDHGETIPETGGLRKIAWGGRGRHAKGGAQVIYYFRDLNMPLYLIAAFPRGMRIKLSDAEKAEMREVIEAIVASQWSTQVSPLIMRVTRPAG